MRHISDDFDEDNAQIYDEDFNLNSMFDVVDINEDFTEDLDEEYERIFQNLPKKIGHYVTNIEIENEYNKSLIINEPTPKLIEYFGLIATNSSVLLGIKSKLDIGSCISYGISRAWEKWDKYDPNNSQNYFSFYTTMILNDMRTHRDRAINKNSNKMVYFADIFMD